MTNSYVYGLIVLAYGVFNTTLYAQDSAKKNLHVYLLIGQSNMAGRAPFNHKDAAVVKRAYLLNDKNEWEPAKNPLNRYSTIRKSLDLQKMNPGYAFVKTILATNKNVSIGLVVNARGGSSIKQWTKSSKFYKEALKRTRIALKNGTLKGILWHQGESDAKDARYLDKLKILIANLRSDFGIPNLPFVAGQINRVPLINEQIKKLPEVVPHTGYVTSKGLKTMDRWHFNPKSIKILGERYAKEMLKLHTELKVELKKVSVEK